MEKPKKYYWVEMDSDTASAIATACDTVSHIAAGKLDIIEEMCIAGYRKRMNKEPDETLLDQVHNSLKLIQYLCWDTTIGNPVNVHGYSNYSDTLNGVNDVLSYKLGVDNYDGYDGARYPIQWNDKIPLPRIVRIRESKQNRKKQLSLFVE